MSARTLPIRVPPLPGEAIDSWLEAIAARHHASWADILDAVGLAQPRSTVSAWIARPTAEETATLAAATATSMSDIAAATLARYHGLALRIDPVSRTPDKTFPWSPASCSRFCPDCLAATGGRWQLAWRLGWSFACLHHHRLLADTCSACGLRQRRLPLVADAVAAPGCCASPLPGLFGRIPVRCGTELTGTDTLALDPDHPALHAQRTINTIIDTGKADFGVYTGAPQSAEAALTDIRIVAGRVLYFATRQSLAHLIPADLLDAYPPRDEHTGASTVMPLTAPAAPAAAVAVTAALAALGAATAHDGGRALRWLVAGARRSGTKTNASTMNSAASPVLEAVQLSALAPTMSPADQLRHRTTDPMPRRPRAGTPARIRALTRALPTMLWPAWSLPLAIPRPQQRRLRPALSVALLFTGTTLPVADAAQMLGGITDNNRVIRALNLLADCGHWDDIAHALTRMSDYLAEGGAPIDYQRRRGLDYTGLLPEDTWQRICRDTTAGAHNSASAKHARCYLFERLSGLPLDTGPTAVADSHHFPTHTADFVRHLTPQLARVLDDHAREFLTTHDISDEPPSWQPPTSLLHGLSLPGPDPADIDITRLHHLIRAEQRTPGRAADVLATTTDLVRHVLERQPAPPLTEATVTRSAYLTAKTAFPPDTLADLYQRQRLSTADIAARIGVASTVIARLARDYQIPVRKPGRQATTHVDRDWLHAQYITHGRTLTELAHETGITWSTLARWTHRYNIPLRRLDATINRKTTCTTSEIAAAPPLLQPALTQPDGLARLHEFAAASPYPSLVAASEDLTISAQVLRTRISELEHDLGGNLLNRAHAHRPMTLTPLGQAVLDAHQNMLAAPGKPGRTKEMPSN